MKYAIAFGSHAWTIYVPRDQQHRLVRLRMKRGTRYIKVTR